MCDPQLLLREREGGFRCQEQDHGIPRPALTQALLEGRRRMCQIAMHVQNWTVHGRLQAAELEEPEAGQSTGVCRPQSQRNQKLDSPRC